MIQHNREHMYNVRCMLQRTKLQHEEKRQLDEEGEYVTRQKSSSSREREREREREKESM